jgi:hypothetical protein
MTSLVAVLLVLAALPQAPLPLPIGTATIRGHVIRTDGPPLARAEVRLLSTDKPGPPRIATTDESGSYEFATLPAGRYTVTASKTGYVALEFGQGRAFEAGQPIVLKARETRERVDIALPRHGAVAGRVVDENGEPLEGVSVSVKEIRSVGGRRQLVSVPGVLPRQTNELGRYRVYGLQPGDYVVSAEVGQVGSDDLPGYPLTYFPGTINPVEAQRIRIGLSEEMSNVEFALTPVRTARIAGRTFTSSGEPFQAGVQMRPSWRSTGATAEAVGARAQPDGGFEFSNVPPGEYVIQAFKGVEIGWQFVTVNGADVTDLAVTTLPGSTIAGRVTFEGPNEPRRRGLELTPTPADPDLAPFFGTPGSAEIHDDWTFEITDVSGPRRLSVMRAPSGWALKYVLVNGIDATDAVMPFGAETQSLSDVEILLTSEITRITGSVRDSRGTPLASGSVIAFAEDRERWYQGSRFLSVSRPSQDGSFVIAGLPAGSYFVIAVDRLPDGDAWQNPAFLGALTARATRVTLTDGQQLAVNVTVIGR